jgi:hypothetical protein
MRNTNEEYKKLCTEMAERNIKLIKENKENNWKASRYDALKDRYLHQNQKHFYELCGLYFDEDEE